MDNRIKDCREAVGMSQTELAEKSGVSRATIWALETGMKKKTTTSTVSKIAKALDKSVGEIFDFE